ncbi:bifunctional 3,4-dihydroxy-2-butanone-4-phosphate synthase/GTP cyclohydrolase II [Granulosicoccaceae sp. 1_MG-2023]|nr:bifunctional 3,4-dihydroxy-2-butanone-4-phosphate synthase/GTP cyclohydrolase II [Granulosicoccaceae sp. 1_MG-2023]
MAFSSIKEIIDDIRKGKMVILVDDEDRENEGDILIAAEKITPDAINFMATHGRGLICLTLTEGRCKQLNLPLMVSNNTEMYGTNFTVSIEAAEGVHTGISAADRCRTVQAAVAPEASPADIVMPGHIFPVMAQKGGVLTRAGHTEAGCDIARLAGLEPSCVIVEVLNEDGTMARRPQLEVFAEKHGIKIGTIAELIEYRYASEKSVERIASCPLETEYGEFTLHTFQDHIDDKIHFALTRGDLNAGDSTLVRVHSPEVFGDILHEKGKTWSLPNAMRRIAEEGGVLVILANQETDETILGKIKRRCSTEPTIGVAPMRAQTSQIGIGSQILSDLGVSRMRLLTSTEARYHSLSGFGLEVVEYICQ